MRVVMRLWFLWSTGYGLCAFMGFSEALEVWFVIWTGGESSRVQVWSSAKRIASEDVNNERPHAVLVWFTEKYQL